MVLTTDLVGRAASDWSIIFLSVTSQSDPIALDELALGEFVTMALAISYMTLAISYTYGHILTVITIVCSGTFCIYKYIYRCPNLNSHLLLMTDGRRACHPGEVVINFNYIYKCSFLGHKLPSREIHAWLDLPKTTTNQGIKKKLESLYICVLAICFVVYM